MKNSFKFLINTKETLKNSSKPKVFSSKDFTDKMILIINDKLKDKYNEKYMKNIIDAIINLNKDTTHPFISFQLKDTRSGVFDNYKNIEKSFNEGLKKNQPPWSNKKFNKINDYKNKNKSYVEVSDARNPKDYFRVGLILIDLALHLNIDLEFEIKDDEKSILKIKSHVDLEDETIENYIKEKSVFDDEVLEYNIELKIGQPNTGKSFSFEENQLFKNVNKESYEYYKIMVEGGNDSLKALTSEDITISYNPVKNEAYLSKFLKTIMSAIVNDSSPHVIFLDDFHNVDISSLLSPYMGMLKNFQSFDNVNNNIIREKYSSLENYTEKWNNYIEDIKKENPSLNIFTIENKINGQQIKIFAPSNLYIVGAANWNYNTINMFADIRERAYINYKGLEVKPIDNLSEISTKEDYKSIIGHINYSLKEVLEDFNIYDFEKYGVGIHRIEKIKELSINNITSDLLSLFDLIRDSIQQNGQKGYINEISYLLIKELLKIEALKNIIEAGNIFEFEDYEVLLEDCDNKKILKEVNRKLVSLNLYGN